jgi:diadenosine tetraphosphate (Ap4A) HIT family hydrolase
MSDTRTCCLCSQIAGDAKHDLIRRTIGDQMYVRRIPIETKQFVVIPSVGPLSRGHSLLCPRDHIKNIGQLPLVSEREFAAIKSKLRKLLWRVFEAPVHCFEHGSASATSRVLCTVDHAHLHFVPSGVDVLHTLRSQGDWVEIRSSLDSLSATVGEKEYLYYETPEGRSFVAKGGPAGFESQYLRRIFAAALHRLGDWDWRRDLRIDEVDQTFRDLVAAARS